jgi:hypothetical protein
MSSKAVLSAALVLVAIAATVEPALPRDRRSRDEPRIVRPEQPPAKDCTRINGRHGYYANPFCTPAEQLAFDRWEVRRLGRQQ